MLFDVALQHLSDAGQWLPPGNGEPGQPTEIEDEAADRGRSPCKSDAMAPQHHVEHDGLVIPVALMISSRVGRSFSTAFKGRIRPSALCHPLGLEPSARTGTISALASDRYVSTT